MPTPMYEVRNRVYLDADGKPTDADKAVDSIPPGRITQAEAKLHGLPDAETTDEQVAATENLTPVESTTDAPDGLTTADIPTSEASKKAPKTTKKS